MKMYFAIVCVVFSFVKNQSLAEIVLNESQTAYLCSQLEQLKLAGYIDDTKDPVVGFVDYVRSSNTQAKKGKPVNEEQLLKVVGVLAYQFATCFSAEDSLDTLKRWLRLSKEHGHSEAEFGLARLTLLYGGESIEEKRAVDLLEQQFNHGMEYEGMVLAVAYFKGRGVNRNVNTALERLEVAAVNGHPMAQHLLIHIYKNGLFGVDNKEAQNQLKYLSKDEKPAFECSVKAFVEYGVLELGEIETTLIRECARIVVEEETTP